MICGNCNRLLTKLKLEEVPKVISEFKEIEKEVKSEDGK